MERIIHENKDLKTISLFSGAGGLDLGFLNAGFDIIWANDFDKNAVKTYKENIDDHIVQGDINEVLDLIPSHDVLLAGFPCQPFSMMGSQEGFNDDEQGTLFFTIEKILRRHETKIIVLENVKNLETHDDGKTFKKMKRILEDDLEYKLFYKTLNTSDYGIPHTRRRLFIIGFKKSEFDFGKLDYKFPASFKLETKLQDVLDKDVDKKYFLSEKILKTIMATGTKNYSAKPEIDLKIARPLCATMHKMHRASQDNYVTDDINRGKFEAADKPISKIRRLTPNECRKLQGFPSDWKYIVSDTQLYRQFGNAVTVDVAYYLAKSISDSLNSYNNLELKETSNDSGKRTVQHI